jgi:dihydroorotase
VSDDLLVRGGTVIDPAEGLDGPLDLAVRDGRIAAIGANLPSKGATRVFDASGMLVLPGLIDLHCHVFARMGIGADPDVTCLPYGVTTAVDGGSAGAATIDAFRAYVMEPARTRLYAWLHLASQGLIDIRLGELTQLAFADVEACVAAIAAHRDRVVGIKLRASNYAVGMSALPALRLLREAADAARVPVMVHIGASGESLATILQWLRPGDVVTHILTGWPNGALDAGGRVLDEVREAQQRGIYFDAAHGRMHVSFAVTRQLLDQGFLPNGLSTDVTVPLTQQDPDFHLVGFMNKLLALGVSLRDVVPLVTRNPGALLNREPWLGRLRVDAPADACVLGWQEGDYALRDSVGARQRLARRLVPRLALKDGLQVGPPAPPA